MATSVIEFLKCVRYLGQIGDAVISNLNDIDDGLAWVNDVRSNISNMPPSGKAFHVWTCHTIPTHGFQIALRYDMTSPLYVRTVADGTWKSWKSITLS